MPMLTTAYSLAIKYPRNEEAASAKSFATQQVGLFTFLSLGPKTVFT